MHPVKLFTFLLLLNAGSTHAQMPALIPYYDGKLWGYANTNHEVVIKPQWDSAGFFVDGRALVLVKKEKNIATCIVNGRGEYIVPPERNWNGEWKGKSFQRLNAFDDYGRWGLVDTNNNLLINFEYDKPPGPYFGLVNDGVSKKWFMIPWKNGKVGVVDDSNHVVVPFEYYSVLPLWMNWPGGEGPVLFRVSKGSGETGLMDMNGKTIVRPEYEQVEVGGYQTANRSVDIAISKPGEYKPSYHFGWVGLSPGEFSFDPAYSDFFVSGRYIFYKRSGDSLYGVMDTTGRVLQSPRYASVQFCAPDYFVYKLPGNPYFGITDSGFKLQMEPVYEHISLVNGIIKATKNEDKFDDSDKYFILLDKEKLLPSGNWQHDTTTERQWREMKAWSDKYGRELYMNEGTCGGGRSRLDYWERERSEKARGHVCMPDYVFEFDKDSLHFEVRSCVEKGKKYYCVQSTKYKEGGRKLPAPLYAVVDEQYRYFISPQGEEVHSMDLKSKITVIKKDSLFSFMDSTNARVFPYQRLEIVAPFVFKNEWYAYGTRDRTEKTWIEVDDENNAVISSVSGYSRAGSRDFDSICKNVREHIDWHRDPQQMSKVLLKNGAPVKELRDYDFVRVISGEEIGLENQRLYFLARNMYGRVGVVSLKGKVLLPKVSFQYRQLEFVNSEILLAGVDVAGQKKLVNRVNIALFPGLNIVSAAHPAAPSQLLNEKVQQALKGLFKVVFEDATGQKFFYMDAAGIPFAKDFVQK